MSYIPSCTQLLFNVSSPISHTGDTNRFALYTYTLKGGTMGINDTIKIVTYFTNNNSANNKTHEFTFGSKTYLSLVQTTNLGNIRVMHVCNANSLSSQIGARTNGALDYGTFTTLSLNTSTENTANDVIIGLYTTLANSGDTGTINKAYAYLIREVAK